MPKFTVKNAKRNIKFANSKEYIRWFINNFLNQLWLATEVDPKNLFLSSCLETFYLDSMLTVRNLILRAIIIEFCNIKKYVQIRDKLTKENNKVC